MAMGQGLHVSIAQLPLLVIALTTPYISTDGLSEDFDYLYQSLFKTSHVTRRPSLKRLSGIQVQLLSLWMGKYQILQ